MIKNTYDSGSIKDNKKYIGIIALFIFICSLLYGGSQFLTSWLRGEQ